MLSKMLRSVVLIVFALAPYGVGQAADMCRLKGGSLVQLPAEACKVEGGTQVNEAATSNVPVVVAVPAGDAASEAKLTPAQKVVVDLLNKPVVDTTPLNRNPEGIERTSSFDGCKLMVDEAMHIQHGNLISTLKNFKINSVIDFQKINRDEFGILGNVASKAGELKASAVYFEERKRKEGNNLSISVLESKNGGLAKYSSHVPGAYWEAPRGDLWIADEYGYPKDSGWGTLDAGKIRILLIVNSSGDAEKLEGALKEVNAMCRSQQAGAN